MQVPNSSDIAERERERREQFASAVVAQVSLPLDYVRLNVSAIGGTAAHIRASRTG
jgi:hypothetical protein